MHPYTEYFEGYSGVNASCPGAVSELHVQKSAMGGVGRIYRFLGTTFCLIGRLAPW